MLLARRSFIAGVGASMICAPAIVRAASLMPVRLFDAGTTLVLPPPVPSMQFSLIIGERTILLNAVVENSTALWEEVWISEKRRLPPLQLPNRPILNPRLNPVSYPLSNPLSNPPTR